MIRLINITAAFILLLLIIAHNNDAFCFDDVFSEDLNRLLNLEKANKEKYNPPERIIRKEENLYCTGKSKAAQANNQAVKLMETGKYQEAKDLFLKALKRAPLFYPFHYNIGKCYYHLLKNKRALMHLNKARYIIPDYFLAYIQIGHIYNYQQKDSLALDYYRKALHLYPKYFNLYIYIGDLYFKRNQLTIADLYYSAVLKKDPYFPDAISGKAKIKFKQKKYYLAYHLFKTIKIKGDYNKSLHYYYAECAYKMQDYKEAYNQYTKLLEYKSDRFFITTSIRKIIHKQNLAKDFVDIAEKK